MNLPKHFAQHVAIKPDGTIFQYVVLTPPLDTGEEAQAYSEWYNREENLMYRVLRDSITTAYNQLGGDIWHPLTHVVRVFETTLY